MTASLLYILCLICLVGGYHDATRFYNKIYKILNSNSPCILRLNGTHTFGCTSDYRGNAGVIYLARNDNDIRWLETNKAGSFIVLMYQNLFTLDNLMSLNKLDSVNGILLVTTKNHSTVYSFSNEDVCPNRYSGLSGTYETCDKENPWNPWGSQIMTQKWKFPIFLTSDNDNVSISECYTKFNIHSMDSWLNQQCSLQLFSHMFAGANSRRCMRRSDQWLNLNPTRYCDPLANKNIYVPLYPLHLYNRVKPRSLIIVAARLDATSMFYNRDPGALAAATSIVTLLTTANILFNMLKYNEGTKYDKNVLFMVFNGEAYDYIGSGRTVYDMENDNFPFRDNPIKKEDIRIFIELSQIANNKTVFSHYIKSDQATDSVVIDFIERFKKFAAKYEIHTEEVSSGKLIPPASVQTFLSADKKLPGLVLGSYKEQFTNRFYHSIFDDYSNAHYVNYYTPIFSPDSLPVFISEFSVSLASALYTMMNDSDVPVVPSTDDTVNDLLYAYLVNSTSPLFSYTNRNIVWSYTSQPSFYVGASGTNIALVLTIYELAYLTSVKRSDIVSVDNCTAETTKNSRYLFYWVFSEKHGFCLQSTVNTTAAVSPAFILEDYNMTSNKYSTWTESQWRITEIRMFVTASRRYEIFTLALGLIIFILSFVIVYRFKRNLEYLGIQH